MGSNFACRGKFFSPPPPLAAPHGTECKATFRQLHHSMPVRYTGGPMTKIPMPSTHIQWTFWYACRIMGYLPHRALASGKLKGRAPTHLSLQVGGVALPCICRLFGGTSSAPALCTRGGTSSVAHVGAAQKKICHSQRTFGLQWRDCECLVFPALTMSGKLLRVRNYQDRLPLPASIIPSARSMICHCSIQRRGRRRG